MQNLKLFAGPVFSEVSTVYKKHVKNEVVGLAVAEG